MTNSRGYSRSARSGWLDWTVVGSLFDFQRLRTSSSPDNIPFTFRNFTVFFYDALRPVSVRLARSEAHTDYFVFQFPRRVYAFTGRDFRTTTTCQTNRARRNRARSETFYRERIARTTGAIIWNNAVPRMPGRRAKSSRCDKMCIIRKDGRRS